VIAEAVGKKVNKGNSRDVLYKIADDVVEWSTKAGQKNEEDVLEEIMDRFDFSPCGKPNVFIKW